LNIERKTVVIKGVSQAIDPDKMRLIDEALFVSANALARWLPLDFAINLRSQVLEIHPRGEDIPMEKRMKRSKKGFGSITRFDSVLPQAETPYSLLSLPTVDVDLSLNHSQSGSNMNGTLRAYGDFAGMNGDIFVSASKEGGINNAYVRFGRKDPKGGLLSYLNATLWEIGDINTTTLPLVSRSQSGRGIHISSRSTNHVSEFDNIVLEGVLLPGYEVEQYRNNILMGSQRFSGNGKYRFDRVILLRGQNSIRLEFYGPQGQRRTETSSYYMGSDRMAVGTINYDLSVYQAGLRVYDTESNTSSQGGDGSLGGTFSLDYGLTRDISLTAGIAFVPTSNKEDESSESRKYATLGLRTQLMGVGLAVHGAVDDTGGFAAGINAQTLLNHWNLSFNHEQYFQNFDAQSSSNKNATPRLSRSSARIQRSFSNLLFKGLNFDLGFNGDYQTYDGRESNWSLGNTIGINYKRLSITNTIRQSVSGADTTTQGSINLNLNLPYEFSLRTSAHYDLVDMVDQYSVGISKQLPYQVNFNLNYNRQLSHAKNKVPDGSTTYSLALTREFSFVNLGFRMSRNEYDDPDSNANAGWSAGATISFSLFPDFAAKSVMMSSQNMAQKGAIRTRAFRDDNGDGLRDANEPYLSDVKVLSQAYGKIPYVTQADKVVPLNKDQLTGAGRWLDVMLDSSTMPDPSYYPASRGRSVLPRSGVVSNLDLPVMVTADIEGMVNFKIGKKIRPLPNITVQIIQQGGDDKKEKIIAEAKTEFDGIYVISHIPIGTYQVRILPEQAKQIGVQQLIIPTITLTHETDLLEKVDIELVRPKK
ncbi:MAG: hypothetical protein KAU26_09685, partial [Methylococcales bacterium]|nr:hypothetical protein [Methylococcales bacterium]